MASTLELDSRSGAGIAVVARTPYAWPVHRYSQIGLIQVDAVRGESPGQRRLAGGPGPMAQQLAGSRWSSPHRTCPHRKRDAGRSLRVDGAFDSRSLEHRPSHQRGSASASSMQSPPASAWEATSSVSILSPGSSHSIPGLTASLQLTQRPRNLAPPRSRESPAGVSSRHPAHRNSRIGP